VTDSDPASSAEPTPPLAHAGDLPDAPEPPPRGVRVMAIVRWVILVLAVLAAAGAWRAYVGGESSSHGASSVKYQCPMHPQIVQDSPGECPICHMTLEPISADRLGRPASSTGHAAAAVPGTTDIKLALDRVQAIGMRTALVVEQPGSVRLRATATVSAPDQNIAEVHVRSPGFVESISVREAGVKVKRGQYLFSLYSPEVYQAQSELLATRDWPVLGDAGAADRTQLGRRRLELLGVPTGATDRILADGKPARTVGISTPIAGYVTKKNVVLGSYVTPEMMLYEIVDLSTVYVIAEVFQQDASQIKVGTPGRFTVAARPDIAADVKVDLIYPQLDAEARTTRVRMQVPNAKLGLLPGEYGYVEFSGEAATALVVPHDAVVDTGNQTYVFVQKAAGTFSPRAVTLGRQIGDVVEVRSGLAAGERVVSGATFLIDSESRLQASISSGPESPSGGGGSACDAAVDRAKFPDKHTECLKCEQVHRGMGSMVDDCKQAIPKPWR
jgi:membrane fusion protein, copper/silver efflux system